MTASTTKQCCWGVAATTLLLAAALPSVYATTTTTPAVCVGSSDTVGECRYAGVAYEFEGPTHWHADPAGGSYNDPSCQSVCID